MKLIFFLVLYLHFVGCCWFYLAKSDEVWIPPLDYMFVATDLLQRIHFYCDLAQLPKEELHYDNAVLFVDEADKYFLNNP